MVSIRARVRRSPLRSRREMTSPTRPRRTPSGLTITKVLCTATRPPRCSPAAGWYRRETAPAALEPLRRRAPGRARRASPTTYSEPVTSTGPPVSEGRSHRRGHRARGPRPGTGMLRRPGRPPRRPGRARSVPRGPGGVERGRRRGQQASMAGTSLSAMAPKTTAQRVVGELLRQGGGQGRRSPPGCGPRRAAPAGSRRTTSMRPGERAAAAASATAAGVEGPAEEGLHRRHGHRQVGRLVAAQQRQAHLRVGPVDALQVDQPARPRRAAPRPPRSPCPSRSQADPVAAARCPATSRASGGKLARDQDPPRAQDGRLLAGDGGQRVPQVLGVLQGDRGDRRHLGIDHVGGVEAPAQTHLDHGGVHRPRGEPGEGQGGGQLEVGDAVAGALLEQVGEGQHVLEGGAQLLRAAWAPRPPRSAPPPPAGAAR